MSHSARVHISSMTWAAWLTMKTVPAFCRSCVILFSLRSLKAASPVDRASSMRRMSGFDAAAIAKRRREAMPEE